MNEMRGLPAVDAILQSERAVHWTLEYGRPLTIRAIRWTLDEIRQKLKNGQPHTEVDGEAILQAVETTLAGWLKPTLLPVINATGVILHTNLGRALLSQEAVNAIASASLNYSTLEFDLEKGKRGSREVHAEALLRHLTGAEAALVVNNNAAALLLCLSALARRKRVVIARSQLVEIGGGFRIPEVMSQSGAILVEVGTTNRVRVHDFEEALQEPAGLVLRAHHSNYKIIGFTEEPALSDLVDIAHARGVHVLDDLGSGALLDTARFGLAHEPTVQESLAAGADLVCFSGDKLLGGPQAGVIIGKADLVAKIRRHPLARAVRADKLCLAALAATIGHYLKNEAEQKIPAWKMIALPQEQIRARAVCWRERLQRGEIISGLSTVGGGSLPEETLPTWLLALSVRQPNCFLARLRAASPAVIARIQDERVVFDPRTVLPEQESGFLSALESALE